MTYSKPIKDALEAVRNMKPQCCKGKSREALHSIIHCIESGGNLLEVLEIARKGLGDE